MIENEKQYETAYRAAVNFLAELRRLDTNSVVGERHGPAAMKHMIREGVASQLHTLLGEMEAYSILNQLREKAAADKLYGEPVNDHGWGIPEQAPQTGPMAGAGVGGETKGDAGAPAGRPIHYWERRPDYNTMTLKIRDAELRDVFAMEAMHAWSVDHADMRMSGIKIDFDFMADHCYKFADAMMRGRLR